MKRLILSLNCVALIAACSNSTGMHITSSKAAAPTTAEPTNSTATAAAPTALMVAVKGQFAVPPSARALVGGDTISRRTGGYLFQTDQVPKINFAKPEVQQATAKLRDTAQRFFFAGGATDIAARLVKAPLDPESPLWQLTTGDPLAVAFTVPESGTVVLQRRTAWKDQTPIRDSSEAVFAALGAIADNQLLNLAPGETVDIIGVHARHMGVTDDSSASSTKVGYKVFLGRVYNGIPVHGPATSVGLDSSGKLSLFRRGWREIASAEGTIAVAADDIVNSRRDPLQAHFLAKVDITCGYVEDETWSAVQDGPGIGCAYGYSDPQASDALATRPVDWVNASADGSIPLRGTVPSRAK
jgi:hypothetical protein